MQVILVMQVSQVSQMMQIMQASMAHLRVDKNTCIIIIVLSRMIMKIYTKKIHNGLWMQCNQSHANDKKDHENDEDDHTNENGLQLQCDEGQAIGCGGSTGWWESSHNAMKNFSLEALT